MILSRLVLSPACPDVWHWIRDPNALHGALWRAFPHEEYTPDARAKIGLLHRLEVDERGGRLLLYVQATPSPRWDLVLPAALSEAPHVRGVGDLYARVGAGDVLTFRLRACPRREIGTRRCKHEPIQTAPQGGAPPASPRKQVRRAIGRANGADVAWLARQGRERYGFELGPVDSKDANAKAARVYLGRQFDGELRVTDAAKFQEALHHGVGPQKAYGYGLLSIAPRILDRGTF